MTLGSNVGSQTNRCSYDRNVVGKRQGRMFVLVLWSKAYKLGNMWYSPEHHFIMLRKSSCPEVQWEDEEPTKVKLVIER